MLIFLASLLAVLDDHRIGLWIGLRIEPATPKVFKWMDNSALTYKNWAPNEPPFTPVSCYIDLKKCQFKLIF